MPCNVLFRCNFLFLKHFYQWGKIMYIDKSKWNVSFMSFGERCANTMQKQNISSSQQSIMGEKTSSTGRLDERENRLNGNITFCPAVIFPHYLHSIVDTVRDRFGFIQRLFSVPCFLKKKKNVCKCVFANPIL